MAYKKRKKNFKKGKQCAKVTDVIDCYTVKGGGAKTTPRGRCLGPAALKERGGGMWERKRGLWLLTSFVLEA